MQAEEIVELRNERDYDYNRSINRHSTRTYSYKGRKFYLDRNLSGVPPFFTLYFFEDFAFVSKHIPVNGQEGWGDGFSWKKAEEIMRTTLKETITCQ